MLPSLLNTINGETKMSGTKRVLLCGKHQALIARKLGELGGDVFGEMPLETIKSTLSQCMLGRRPLPRTWEEPLAQVLGIRWESLRDTVREKYPNVRFWGEKALRKDVNDAVCIVTVPMQNLTPAQLERLQTVVTNAVAQLISERINIAVTWNESG
jgi:hypothetical protein